MVHNTEGLDKKRAIEGMKHEVEQMKKQGVYCGVNIKDLTPEQQATKINRIKMGVERQRRQGKSKNCSKRTPE